MTSKRLAQFFIVILSISPIFALASSQDYLFVSFDYDYATQTFSKISADERVVDSSKVVAQDVGDYAMTLEDSQGIISQARFFIPDPTIVETESLGNDAGSYGSPKYYSATVALALTRSVQASDGTIMIKHNGQVLLSQKLSDTPIIILKSSIHSVLMPTTEPSFPPYPSLPNKYSFPHIIWLWLPIGAIVLMAILLGWFLLKKKNQNIPPPQLPNE